MSKAEDRVAKKALEKFPILFSERMGYDKTNLQQERRNAFEKGYHQAEKDNELTWEDIADILDITDVIANDDSMEERLKLMSEEEYCQEVLKRFKKGERNYD